MSKLLISYLLDLNFISWFPIVNLFQLFGKEKVLLNKNWISLFDEGVGVMPAFKNKFLTVSKK